MDDFRVVLRMAFLGKVKVVPLLILNLMAIMEEDTPCVVPMVIEGTPKIPLLLIMLENKGLKKKQVT